MNFENNINQITAETIRGMKNLNNIIEKEISMYYDTLILSNIISLLIFIAMIYYIYKAHKRAEELERENNIIKHRIMQLEDIMEENIGKKIRKNKFFDSEF